MAEVTQQEVTENMKEYYGKTLLSSGDLKTSACTVKGSCKERKKIAAVTKLIHEKVKERYFGCGLIAPDLLQDQLILDLGCGAGMDCYILSKLTGENGKVVGVDMTDEMLVLAREYIDYHREVFGFKKANTEFITGYIEDLKSAGINDESQNVIISNCVINLTADKRPVLSEAHRVLKPGGEMYFSDMYCDKEIPAELKKNKILWGEGLSGALNWQTLHKLAKEVGFATPILVESYEMTVDNEQLAQLTSGLKYLSATYRLFRLKDKDTSGSMDVTYNGGVELQEDQFKFAHNIIFKKGSSLNVPAEVGRMILESRYSNYFTVGNRKETESKIPLVVNPFSAEVVSISSS